MIHLLPQISSFIAETHLKYGLYKKGQLSEHCKLFFYILETWPLLSFLNHNKHIPTDTSYLFTFLKG